MTERREPRAPSRAIGCSLGLQCRQRQAERVGDQRPAALLEDRIGGVDMGQREILGAQPAQERGNAVAVAEISRRQMQCQGQVAECRGQRRPLAAVDRLHAGFGGKLGQGSSFIKGQQLDAVPARPGAEGAIARADDDRAPRQHCRKRRRHPARLARIGILDMHQPRHGGQRRGQRVATGGKLQPLGEVGREVGGDNELVRVERHAQIAAREPFPMIPVAAVDKIRLAHPRHAEHHHRPARPVHRKQKRLEPVELLLAADKNISRPQIHRCCTGWARGNRRTGARPHPPDFTQLGGRLMLPGQQGVESAVTRISLDASHNLPAPDRTRNHCILAIGEQYGDELPAVRPRIEKLLADQPSFP
jgi:hypothetical protein